MGIEHGAFCVGCCWVLMALLFVGGIMNVLWIAVLATVVLLEKLAPGARGLRASRVSFSLPGARQRSLPKESWSVPAEFAHQDEEQRCAN